MRREILALGLSNDKERKTALCFGLDSLLLNIYLYIFPPLYLSTFSV